MPSLRERMSAALIAFREPALVTNLYNDVEWNDFDARRFRYALYWSLYESTAYDDMNRWSVALKDRQKLYKFIRAIENPVFQIIEMHATHLMGGILDPAAGDGEAIASAIPIQTEIDTLRPALAALWKASNWYIFKDVWTRNGATYGDTALRIVDDVQRQQVYLEVIHPGEIRSIACDPQGNVKAYTLEYQRAKAPNSKDLVTMVEEVERDGANVIHRIFQNGRELTTDATGQPLDPTFPYGFTPFVVTQHNHIGKEWGWSELHPGLPLFRECDDIASKLNDQIRKKVSDPKLIAGAQAKDLILNETQGGLHYIAVPNTDVSTHSLTSDLHIADVNHRIEQMLDHLRDKYPELHRKDATTSSGDGSGRALRTARQRVSDKILKRRAAYDHALVKAQQMAIAIGGERGYPGYTGFNLASYARGDLDHSIKDRPVFDEDPLDHIEIEKAFYDAAVAAKNAGVDIELYLEFNGWDAERIQKVRAHNEEK